MSGVEKITLSFRANVLKPENTEEGGVRLLEIPSGAQGEEGRSRPQAGSNGGTTLAEEKAREIIVAAEEKAEMIEERARSTAEAIYQGAYERGQQEGRREGKEEAKEKLKRRLDEIEGRWKSLKNEHREVLEGLEDQLVEMLLDLAEKVFRRYMGHDREMMIEMVRVALDEFSEISDVTLVVCPDDLPVIMEHREKLQTHLPPRASLLLNAQDDLDSGEFRIRGDEGVLEVTVEDLTRSVRRLLEGPAARQPGQGREPPHES